MMVLIVARSKIIRGLASLFIPILFLFDPSTAFSEEEVQDALRPEDELEEELKYLKAETYVITPSRIPQRIEKAPGAIYVVTDRQIRQMGARTLEEVIETVPGWYAYKTHYNSSWFNVRGVTGAYSCWILFMINSHIVNEPFRGSAIYFGIPYIALDNVKRIEIVNGGISSIYGANANGVINVITKEGEDIDGLQMTARGGSYDTWETNVLFGKKVGKLEVAAYLDYFSTDGFEGQVEQDMQTVSDNRYGTHASLAPGNMKGDRDQWHAQLTAKYEGLKFDGTYIRREREVPFGFYPRLDNMSNDVQEEYYLNLSYAFSPLDGLDLLTKIYRNQYRWKSDLQDYPKGSIVLTPGIPPGWTILSESLVQFQEDKYSRTGVEAQSTCEITDSNILIAGVAYEEMKLYPSSNKSNYTPVPPGVIPLPSVQDWPDDMKYSKTKRNFKALYAEDIWDMTEHLRLTIGGRYDYYSDFGGEFSPRAGLNWGFSEDYYVKLLYAHSFRAPSFSELYDKYTGSPDLEPETTDGWSLTLGGRFLRSFSGNLSFFYGKSEHVIWLMAKGATYTVVSTGKGKKRGLELEMKYDFGRGTYLAMNYTYVTIETINPDQKCWWEPQQLGTLMANVRLTRHLNFNSYLLYRADWTRNIDDSREDPPDYAIVNATLIAKNFGGWFKGIELRGSVHNLFDKDHTSPFPITWLPDDLPQPGRTFLLEARYTF